MMRNRHESRSLRSNQSNVDYRGGSVTDAFINVAHTSAQGTADFWVPWSNGIHSKLTWKMTSLSNLEPREQQREDHLTPYFQKSHLELQLHSSTHLCKMTFIWNMTQFLLLHCEKVIFYSFNLSMNFKSFRNECKNIYDKGAFLKTLWQKDNICHTYTFLGFANAKLREMASVVYTQDFRRRTRRALVNNFKP